MGVVSKVINCYNSAVHSCIAVCMCVVVFMLVYLAIGGVVNTHQSVASANMSAFLNVPSGVSAHLVQELQRIQDQMLVLVDNHEVGKEGKVVLI